MNALEVQMVVPRHVLTLLEAMSAPANLAIVLQGTDMAVLISTSVLKI